MLLEIRDEETGEGMTDQQVRDEVFTVFLAGHETTASSLTWAFFILSQRPEFAERIRAEVAEVVGDGPVLLEHTKRLPFVRNFFREVLRLYPPITFLPRVAGKDTVIGDRKVPRGTMLMIAPWSMHRHVKLWEQPELFDPDRFLPERESKHVPGAYLPFGSGPRICVGAAFATIETALIIARLVRRCARMRDSRRGRRWRFPCGCAAGDARHGDVEARRERERGRRVIDAPFSVPPNLRASRQGYLAATSSA